MARAQSGKRRRLRKPGAFTKAIWFLQRGYPSGYIAWRLKVNRHTVVSWSKRAGVKDNLIRLAKRIAKLSDVDRARLLSQFVENQ